MLNQVDQVGDYSAGDICHAAARMIGALAWGENLAPSQLDSVLMQLDGLLKDGKSPDETGNLMLALAGRIAQEFDVPLWNAEIWEPIWYGDTTENIAPARTLIAAWPYTVWEERRAQLTEFYCGEQWDADISQERWNVRRPTLVINRIPALVAASIQKELEGGLPSLTPEELDRLILIVTSRNADCQRVYNYTVSARAEMIQAQLDMMGKRIVVASPEKG